ncbi:MAG: glutamine synthetase [Alphaproteobacteria bacterium]|nr:glutamine synthetase [Alphaproteobacteria bacterium]
MSFVERHGLWSAEDSRRAAEIEKRIKAERIETVRLSFADQHGILRGKTVVAADLPRALREGVGIVTTLFLKDSSHRTVYNVWQAGGGLGRPEWQSAADALLIPDPATFRVLPWAPGTGWLLCQPFFHSGAPMPFDTRRLYRRALDRLAEAGFDYTAGLEVEFHIFRLLDPKLAPHNAGQPGDPPEIGLLTQGYQYLTEQRYDQLEPALEILRRDLARLDLPLRSLECEYGPSQAELTFFARDGLAPADDMVLLRGAAKQIARRHGYHVSFMCRPRIPNVMSSGWHLHQSLKHRKTGANAFIPDDAAVPLSETGMRFMAGVLAHARGATALSTPTVNGYKRYRPYSLAPDRVAWGRDSRGALVRVLAAPGDPGSRIENRGGEPAANPYLYMASQVLAGLDGLVRKLDPGPSADAPYDVDAPRLPSDLGQALAALRDDFCLVEGLGAEFVDYYARLKRAEIARYEAEVSEWEQREYFDLF